MPVEITTRTLLGCTVIIFVKIFIVILEPIMVQDMWYTITLSDFLIKQVLEFFL